MKTIETILVGLAVSLFVIAMLFFTTVMLQNMGKQQLRTVCLQSKSKKAFLGYLNAPFDKLYRDGKLTLREFNEEVLENQKIANETWAEVHGN